MPPKKAKKQRGRSVVQTVKQSVKVVVNAAPEKKKRARRRAKPKVVVQERFIASPGFLASQVVASGTNYSAFVPEPFTASTISEMQIKKQAAQGTGLTTSLQNLRQLADPKFDEPVVSRTVKISEEPLQPEDFPLAMSSPKVPRIKQASDVVSDKQRAIEEWKATFPNRPVPKNRSAQKLREDIQKDKTFLES
jgi:hypothetical protein